MKVTPTLTWQAGDHWCAVGRDGGGELLKPVGRGASKEAAIADLRRRCGESVAAVPAPAPEPIATGPAQLGLGVG